MTRQNILGIPVAPAAQQWRVAKIMLGAVLAIGLGACGAFVGPYAWRHYTFVDATAQVTGKELKCHYQVNRFNKRGAAQLTDLVDCEEARRVAAKVDHAMGEIRQVAIVKVTYTLADGSPMGSWFDLPADAAADIVAGQTLPIQYHPDHPHRAQRRADNPFALVARNRYAGAAAIARTEAASRPARAERPKFQLAKDGEPMSTLEIVSRTIAWIIVAGIGLAILWGGRALWRLTRRLTRGQAPTAAATTTSRAAVPAARVATATRAPRPARPLRPAFDGEAPRARR